TLGAPSGFTNTLLLMDLTTNVPLRAVNSLILNRGSALQITNSAVEGDNVFDVAGGTLTLDDGWINCTNITVRVGRTNSTVGTLKLNGGLMQTFKLSVGSAVNSLGAQGVVAVAGGTLNALSLVSL